jgi:predicted ester cyclase
MSNEANKAVIRRFYEEVFNQKNMATIDELISPKHVDHAAPPSLPGGPEGTKQLIGMYLTAFPDLHYTIEDLIAEDEKVVVRFTMRGTQRGPLMGIAPTNKQVTFSGIVIDRIEDGQFVETWFNMDMLGLLQQLGAVPMPGH